MSHWGDEAACIGTDPEAFFPRDYRAQAALEEARSVCRRCPVQEPCLDVALALPEHLDRVGVVAGLTPIERRDLRTDPTLVVVEDTAHLRGGPPEGHRVDSKGVRDGVQVRRPA